jgi:[ribosomal protein S5]-alanine N-acetyltransferase
MNKAINDKTFEEFPLLESKRLIFRNFLWTDVQKLYEIRSNEKVMNYMDTVKHQTIQDAISLINHINKSFAEKNGVNWAIVEKSSNLFIGYFGFWRMMKDHCRAEVGYALSPEFWGQGYMLETMNTLIDFGFNQLKLHSIEANVNPNNVNSIKLLEKSGFKKEAHFRENYFFEGRFIDSAIYCLLESDPR